MYLVIVPSSDTEDVSNAKAEYNTNSRLVSKGQGVMKKSGKPDMPCHFFMLTYKERHRKNKK